LSNVYYPFGAVCSNQNPDSLNLSLTKRTFTACQESSECEFIEFRYLDLSDGKIAEIVVVDFINDQIPSRNVIGIKIRERMALVLTDPQVHCPEVRALRKDFPVVSHLNHVDADQPASLCLYFEPWSSIRRFWTPQKHIQRILWWLAETAQGALHRDDQPVERMFFDSKLEIVLPPDFDERIQDESCCVCLEPIQPTVGDIHVLRLFYDPPNRRLDCKLKYIPLVVHSEAIVHGSIERHPFSLGDLDSQLACRGAPLIQKLAKAVCKAVPPEGIKKSTDENCIVILSIPIKRTANSESESIEQRAFLLHSDLASLGAVIGSLSLHDGKYYSTPIIGNSAPVACTAWQKIKLLPVDVRKSNTREFANIASGIPPQSTDFKGVLAGLGSLGSSLAELWAKEAWGNWTFIDPDYVEPHNIVRHISKDLHVGRFKADVTKHLTELNYYPTHYSALAIPDSVNNINNIQISELLSNADLILDVTTTLDVPRDLSQRNEIGRCVSTFITPDGNSSVLLLEDAHRKIRLDSLEAQYYRAIINSRWGQVHLNGHAGNLWVGAGCRDISRVISYESVQLHAATLAKQIRILRQQPDPCVRVWVSDTDCGALAAFPIQIEETLRMDQDGWQIVYDTGIREKLIQARRQQLPKETGGVIIGFVDQVFKAIYIVDVWPAPMDSKGDETGFTRGIQDLNKKLEEAARRTANIVNYIGEWHSHPPFIPAIPSYLDGLLLDYLAKSLAQDGQPAVIIIIGTADELIIRIKEG